MKCAICGEEIEKEGRKLASGEAICEDCRKESLEAVECETCERLVWANDARNLDGTTECLSCIEEWIKKEILDVTLEAIDEGLAESGEKPWTVEEYQEWQAEGAIEDFDLTRAERRIVKRLIGEGWGLKGGEPAL